MGHQRPLAYHSKLPLENLSVPEFLAIAIAAATKAGWDIGNIIKTGFKAYPHFSMRPKYEAFTLQISGAVAHLTCEFIEDNRSDSEINKENTEQFIFAFNEIKSTITAEELIEKQEKLAQIISELDLANLDQTPSKKSASLNIWSIFKPVKGYMITPLLVDLNILIYILMVVSGVNFYAPESESLIRWGANYNPLTLAGEWWRLITCCFIHIGILHLLMNMYALFFIGMLLEPHLGSFRFTVAYFLTGVTSSMASLAWHDLVVSAGASGAIFGMYGVFLALLTTSIIEKNERASLLSSIAVFVGYSLLSGLKEGIDNAAHLGGLACGLLLGYICIPGLKKPASGILKYGVISVGGILILVGSVFIYSRIPNDIPTYDEKIKSFTRLESKALEFYHLPDTTSQEKLLATLQNEGINYWKESIILINGLEKLKLPEDLHTRNKLLLKYCELRLRSYQLIEKELLESTTSYKDSLGYYYAQIDTTLSIINGEIKK